MGCRVIFEDTPGSAPRYNDKNLRDVFCDVAKNFFDEKDLDFCAPWGNACSDMGDISNVIPSVHPFIGGVTGGGHSVNFKMTDPDRALVISCKVLAGVIYRLLEDGARLAKKVIEEKKVPFASKEEFFKAKDGLSFTGDGVLYQEDGTYTLISLYRFQDMYSYSKA